MIIHVIGAFGIQDYSCPQQKNGGCSRAADIPRTDPAAAQCRKGDIGLCPNVLSDRIVMYFSSGGDTGGRWVSGRGGWGWDAFKQTAKKAGVSVIGCALWRCFCSPEISRAQRLGYRISFNDKRQRHRAGAHRRLQGVGNSIGHWLSLQSQMTRRPE